MVNTPFENALSAPVERASGDRGNGVKTLLKVHFQGESFFSPLRASAIAEAERGKKERNGVD